MKVNFELELSILSELSGCSDSWLKKRTVRQAKWPVRKWLSPIYLLSNLIKGVAKKATLSNCHFCNIWASSNLKVRYCMKGNLKGNFFLQYPLFVHNYLNSFMHCLILSSFIIPYLIVFIHIYQGRGMVTKRNTSRKWCSNLNPV